MFGGDGTQFIDVGLGSPYAAGYSHQMGGASMVEPLFYYAVFSDELIPWLATDYAYNDDFTELTVNLREGVSWSDGEPFNAEDVAFTIQMLLDNTPILANSSRTAQDVASVEVVDDLTVKFTLNGPRPRFFFDMLTMKFDVGIKWVPEHVFKDVEDYTTFRFYDTEQGWPLTTGAYEVVAWTNQQKIYDRRDTWWGVETGFMDAMPEIERIIITPYSTDTLMTQRVVNNEIDSCLDLRALTIPETVAQNPAIITHTAREFPYGYMDWWPTSVCFNCDDGPYTAKEIRWAVTHSINRQQILEVALGGSGIMSDLPFPNYPALMPYIEATQDLLVKYPTGEYNLEKAAALLEGQGYAKDGDGFWAKDGERLAASVGGWQVFTDVGPIIAEQLRQGGFEAEFVTPADFGTRTSDGTQKIWLAGIAASGVVDPFGTLERFSSKYYMPVGQPTQNPYRWVNPEFDAVLEEMSLLPISDPGYMDLYLQAMEIWLDNLVTAPIQQWLHRIPYNTTYWTGWPTGENPSVNGAFWALTFGKYLHDLKTVA